MAVGHAMLLKSLPKRDPPRADVFEKRLNVSPTTMTTKPTAMRYQRDVPRSDSSTVPPMTRLSSSRSPTG